VCFRWNVKQDRVAPRSGLNEDIRRQSLCSQIYETPDDFGDEVLNVRTGVEVVARMRSDTDSASAPAAELILQSRWWGSPASRVSTAISAGSPRAASRPRKSRSVVNASSESIAYPRNT